MIHRESRDCLATALRQYVSGRITNDELDDISVDWRDRGAVAVKERSWCLYSDIEWHKAVGAHYLEKSARHEISRWILFLHSNQEYLWPEYRLDQIVNWPMNLLTLGWWERRKEGIFKEFTAAGNFSVWPFISDSEFQASLKNPKFLTG